MEKIKFMLALSPVAAISIASFFLQGFWLRFGISPFPFLSVQELIVYSAVPFFAFALSVVIGLLLGFLHARNASLKSGGPSLPNWIEWFHHIALIVIVGGLIYVGSPFRWFTGMVVLAEIVSAVYRKAMISEQLEVRFPGSRMLVISVLLMLLGSAGYGMTYADLIKEDNKSNVKIIHGMGADEARFLGKLGGYVFILSSDGKVIQLPADSIKRIEYIGEARSL